MTGLSVVSMKSLENHALALFSWQLSTSPDQWISWLHTLRAQESSVRKVIGSERDSRDTKKPFQILDGLIQEASRGGLSVGNMEALRGVLISDDVDIAVYDQAVDIVEDSAQTPPGLGLTLNSRTVSWPHFPTEKVTTEHSRRASFEDRYPRRLPTPAAWDPASTILDSPQPPSRPRATYEAVQRPVIHSPWGAAPPAYESIAPSPIHVNEQHYTAHAPPPGRYGYDRGFDCGVVSSQQPHYAPHAYFQTMAPAPYPYPEVPMAMPVPDPYYAHEQGIGAWPRSMGIPDGHATRVGASVMGNALAGFGGGIFRTF